MSVRKVFLTFFLVEQSRNMIALAESTVHKMLETVLITFTVAVKVSFDDSY